MHPLAFGKTGVRRNFLPKIRLNENCCGPGLQVYEISSPFMPQFGQTARRKFGNFFFFFAKLAEPNCGAVKLLVELQIDISQRIMHLFSRGLKPRLDNVVVLLTKRIFTRKMGAKWPIFR